MANQQNLGKKKGWVYNGPPIETLGTHEVSFEVNLILPLDGHLEGLCLLKKRPLAHPEQVQFVKNDLDIRIQTTAQDFAVRGISILDNSVEFERMQAEPWVKCKFSVYVKIQGTPGKSAAIVLPHLTMKVFYLGEAEACRSSLSHHGAIVELAI